MKLGDPYRLSCGHDGRIVWISKDKDFFAVKARVGAGSCCNRKIQNGRWKPTVFLIKASDENPQPHTDTSHLTTLVSRFLRTLENVKSWNQLDSLKGEAKLRHHVCNIIEYTFHFHRQQVTEQEVEKLMQLLEEGGTRK
jgi:hypothetical protein